MGQRKKEKKEIQYQSRGRAPPSTRFVMAYCEPCRSSFDRASDPSHQSHQSHRSHQSHQGCCCVVRVRREADHITKQKQHSKGEDESLENRGRSFLASVTLVLFVRPHSSLARFHLKRLAFVSTCDSYHLNKRCSMIRLGRPYITFFFIHLIVTQPSVSTSLQPRRPLVGSRD